jgi:hypothetical protein
LVLRADFWGHCLTLLCLMPCFCVCVCVQASLTTRLGTLEMVSLVRVCSYSSHFSVHVVRFHGSGFLSTFCFVQAPVACPAGCGIAVSASLGIVVVSSDHVLTVYRLAAGFPVMHAFGSYGVGPGQFNEPQHVCFPPWGGGRTLLVAEYGGGRVQEVNPLAQTSIKMWCAGLVDRPWGVAATAEVMAVSEARPSFVALFSVSTGARLWRVGGTGAGPGQFTRPRGVRLARDGVHVIVVDTANSRVCLLRVSDGGHVRDVASAAQGLSFPFDAEEVEGGLVVTSYGNNEVVKVHWDGSAAVVLGGAGAGPGQFEKPSAVAALPGGALVVREEGNGGRFQVMAPK